MQDDNNETNYLQTLFYALLKKMLPTWKEANEFAEKHSINVNTMRDIYYKEGKAGIQSMNAIASKLLKLSPKKLDEMVNAINNLGPLSESTKVWNSIKADEDDKHRFALYCKAIWEIENRLKD